MGKKDHAAAAENIKVLVRCRPLSEKEKSVGHKTCVELDMAQNTVTVNSIIGEPDRWTFDAVINNSYSQEDIFTQFIMPLTESVLSGFNATVFAYGQSGSGKTHTMTGVMGNGTLEGVIPRCVKHIFSSVKKMKDEAPGKTFTMYVSFMELYNGKVRDLLAKEQVSLDIRESKDHTFFVQGAVVAQVKFPEDVIRHLEDGTDRRRVASTELNSDSSRSHSVFALILECTETLEDGSTRAVSSKLNLVDLAGSERQGKTGASGDTLKEGCNINLSLSALGTVIDTIVKGGMHVPFRSSPLTMLLKDSLGGNSKTVMFANINPSERNISETVSTLRFADRAKQIKNKPVVNMDSKDQKIAELTDIVKELREKLVKYEKEGTAGLEEEVSQLRERVGHLNVQLDSAEKSREADLVDFETTRATLSAERHAFNTRLVAMEDEIGQLQNQLQISESNAAAMQSQLHDIWTQCYSYFLTPAEKAAQTLEQLQATKSLEEVLRDADKKIQGGGEAALLETVQSLTADLKASQAEHKATKKELKSSKAQLEKQLAEVKKELAELKGASSVFGSSSGDGQVSLSLVQQQQQQHQAKLLEALQLDDHGAMVIQLLQEENEKLRHQLMSATSPVSGSTAVVTMTPQKSASKNDNAAASSEAAPKSSQAPGAPIQSSAVTSSLQMELEEARAKIEQVTASREELYAELETQRTELAKVELTMAQQERHIAKLQHEYETKTTAASHSEDEIGRLEMRLHERSDQLEQLRTLLEKQKSIIVKNNEKAEYFQISLRDKTEALVALEQQFREQLERKDAQMQQLINKRLADFSEQRNVELQEKAYRQKKLKKKLQRLQDELKEWQVRFDVKVCECEDLRNALEENKVEQLRMLRRLELSGDEAEAVEQKEQIQNTLERAKQQRRRKDDLFDMGEVRSAKTRARRIMSDITEDGEL